MISQLQISLFGTFQLYAHSAILTTVNTPRLQALLAYLVLHRGVRQSRQHLAFLLWPDSTDAQARSNLRTLLHRLRAALPDPDTFLTIDSQSVCWQADAPFTLDVVEFEKALAQAASARQTGDAKTLRVALERAVEIYQGDLLPDCYDEWVLTERDRLQQLAFAALEHLIEHLEQHRDYTAAIAYARRLLQLDSLREPTYLSLMRLYAASGDRTGALRVYHSCTTTLRNELGADPSPATREVYDQLLAAEMPGPIPATSLAASVPLVGRTAEWARARATWQAAASGHTRLLVLVGEAGIGKTRLAEELLTWIARQGAATASARCYAAEGDLAYAPVVEWLRTDALRRSWARLDPLWLSEVGRLVPEAFTERADLAHLGPLTERWQRRRLFEALARAVLATDRPLLLLIDDLHWCDRDTLDWLHFLLRYEVRARLLVVGTVRAEEANGDLTTLLNNLRRTEQLTDIMLGPLSQTDVATLAGHIAGRVLAVFAAADLYTETEGNPLFVVESMRAGLVSDMQLQRSGANEAADLARLPPPVQAVLVQRLDQLTASARDLLHVAAVIGRSFTYQVLARAAESDEDALVLGLDELWQRRIVREQGGDAYDFSHEKLRLVAYQGLSAARRRVLHRRVAEALEAEHAMNLEPVSGQIAGHYEHAGSLNRAVTYYREAADVAQRVSATAEAIDYLRRARALLTAHATDETHEHQSTLVTIHQCLGDLLHLTGQYHEARIVYQYALDVIAPEEREISAHLHRKIGNTWRDHQQYDEAVAAYTAAEMALRVAPDDTSPERWQAWIEIQFERILTCYWLVQVPDMFRLIDIVRPITERYGSPLQCARLWHYLGQAALRRDRIVASAETVGYAQAYLATVETSGATAAFPAAHFQLGLMLLWYGDVDAAEIHVHTALEQAERTGDVSLEARCLTYLTVISRKHGQIDDVRAYAERSLRVALAEQMPDYIGAAHANLAWLAWRAGDRAQARDHGLQALAAWHGTQLVFGIQWTARWPLIGVALAENQVVEVAEYGRALLDQKQQRPPEILEAALEAAVRAADMGNLDAARAEFTRLLEPACALGYL
jgi:DNA-binding SARP family transcriptional activator